MCIPTTFSRLAVSVAKRRGLQFRIGVDAMAEVTTEGFEQVPSFMTSAGIDETAISNRQALMNAYSDTAGRNWQTFENLLDINVVFHEADCLPYGGSYFGKYEALRAFTDLLARFSSLNSETHEILTSGEYCVSYLTITFRVEEKSTPVSMQVAEIYRFFGGKIIDWRVHYFDASLVANALGG